MSDDLFTSIGAEPVDPPGRAPRTATQVWMLAAGLVVLLAAVFGGGVALWSIVDGIRYDTSFGSCYLVGPLDPRPCSDLTVAEIAALSALDLPSGTKVVSSTSSGGDSPGNGTMHAVVLLPQDAPSPLAAGAPPDEANVTRHFAETSTSSGRLRIDIRVDVHGKH